MDEGAHVRYENKRRGQCGPRVKFPDEAVALRLPVEVAVALHFAEGMAVGTRDQESTRGRGAPWKSGSRLPVRQYLFETQGRRQMSGLIKSEAFGSWVRRLQSRMSEKKLGKLTRIR